MAQQHHPVVRSRGSDVQGGQARPGQARPGEALPDGSCCELRENLGLFYANGSSERPKQQGW